MKQFEQIFKKMHENKSQKYTSSENPYCYSVIQNLKDAGCTDEIIAEFMSLQGYDAAGQLRLLTLHRKHLLERLHASERQIDCLDYLLYRMQTENKQ